MDYNEAKQLLIDKVSILGMETVNISDAYNRILATKLFSNENVPSFDRSPLDGYCFNSEDTKGASVIKPKYFEIIEEVPCGKVAKNKIKEGKTIKILTGAKMPDGADCVIKYEDVEIEDNKLKLMRELAHNENIILAGEDVKKGDVLSEKGSIIDMGVVGIAASLGISELEVYKKLKVGFISTGSELLEVGDLIEDGKIYNSNRYIFGAILKKYNIDCKYYGIVNDDIDNLKKCFDKASTECDIVISTGGVSVGDYDLVDKALADLDFNIFVKGIDMKPGMACCFAERDGKIVTALSGNPMSSITTFYAVVLPALKKMMGFSDYDNHYFKVRVKNSFNKKVGKVRFLRAKCCIENGEAVAYLDLHQGNIVVKSLINCNAMIRVENNIVVKEGMIFDCMLL